VIALCEWAAAFPTLAADRRRASRALEGPGAVALLALLDGNLVGFAHAITDGASQAYLALLLVDPAARRKGIGRRLVAASFPHDRFAGVSAFRLRP